MSDRVDARRLCQQIISHRDTHGIGVRRIDRSEQFPAGGVDVDAGRDDRNIPRLRLFQALDHQGRVQRHGDDGVDALVEQFRQGRRDDIGIVLAVLDDDLPVQFRGGGLDLVGPARQRFRLQGNDEDADLVRLQRVLGDGRLRRYKETRGPENSHQSGAEFHVFLPVLFYFGASLKHCFFLLMIGSFRPRGPQRPPWPASCRTGRSNPDEARTRRSDSSRDQAPRRSEGRQP